MEYRIVSDRNQKDVVKWVNSYIKEGWKPIGGVAVLYIPSDYLGEPSFIHYYSQAMTREAPEQEPT